jgi:hypothetical protein
MMADYKMMSVLLHVLQVRHAAVHGLSYFALEAQTGLQHQACAGRQFNNFSKIISAGIGIGIVTGPTPLLDTIDKHISTHTGPLLVN